MAYRFGRYAYLRGWRYLVLTQWDDADGCSQVTLHDQQTGRTFTVAAVECSPNP